ncbi:hypothetical protein [Modestobacter sp. SYSU DS0511]
MSTCRPHLALVMLVETASRRSGTPELVRLLHGWLLDELAAAPS